MAQEAKAPSTHKGHHPPGTMAPKGSKAAAAVEATEAKAEAKAAAAAAAKAAAAEEKKAAAALAKAAAEEEAALKKAAARVGIKRAADGRPTTPAYAPTMDTMMTSDTQVDYDVNDTQDHAPLTDLAGVVMDDDEPLQATATDAEDTAGEDGQQPSESPGQQSPETQTHEACPPIPTTPHQPPDLVCSIVNQSLILSL